MTKGLKEQIDEGILRWFGHMENVLVVAHSVFRPKKRWIEKRFDVRQARRMVHGGSV